MLIAAAREAGKLDELSADLVPLEGQGVENARALLTVVEVARGRGAAAAPLAQAIAADLPRKWPEKTVVVTPSNLNNAAPPAWPDILVARACLGTPVLRPLGEAMARDLIAHAERAQATEFKNVLVHLLFP